MRLNEGQSAALELEGSRHIPIVQRQLNTGGVNEGNNKIKANTYHKMLAE